MSLYGALYSGVSGLNSNSRALGTISENIANVNTVGYKSGRSEFETLVTGSQFSSSAPPGGVTSSARSLVDQQGLLQSSASNTDLGISGDGFFVTNDRVTAGKAVGQTTFTRAGSFSLDSQQNLANSSGLYLMGYKLNPSGTVVDAANKPINPDPTSTGDLQVVNFSGLNAAASATTSLGLTANLPATAVNGDKYTTTAQVYDALGTSHRVDLNWTAAGGGAWALDVSSPDGTITGGGTNVTFDSDGTLKSPDPANLDLTINWDDTKTFAADGKIKLNLGVVGEPRGLTSLGDSYSVTEVKQDGVAFGSFSSVSVSDDGTVTAHFDNGKTLPVFKLAVAQFANPDGLQAKSGNAFMQTLASGSFFLSPSGESGAGKIQANTLEASTVDLASEFTTMITTQRAYSANASVIKTADQMLQELVQLNR